MRYNAGRMYQRTALRNGGRKAGAGIQEADYSEESGPGNEDTGTGSGSGSPTTGTSRRA